MGERVMIVGKGAREHALAHRLCRDSSGNVVREVVIAPGNDGASYTAACIKPNDESIEALVSLAKSVKPSLVVIGPEDYLEKGLSDALLAEGMCVFAPSQNASRIESSKSFMKDIAMAAQIPTASFQVFNNEQDAITFAKTAAYPIVIKADGLCSGKGVTISNDFAEAQSAINMHLKSGPILIEDFLQGSEMSVIALCTNDDALLFAPVQDHKRLLNDNKGPNTGGMGVVGPLPHANNLKFMSSLKEKIFLPALSQMKERGVPFKGALFAGLMVDGDNVRLLEFNARFGDPETQALTYGTDVDLYPILLKIAQGGKISEFSENLLLNMMPTAAITVAARGYPDAPVGGDRIAFPEVDSEAGKIFFYGVVRNPTGYLATSGGRILSCVSRDTSLRVAIRKSYDIVSGVSFAGAQFRTDIGRTLL